jgi:protein-L-isoaspartate O-methyltransferase
MDLAHKDQPVKEGNVHLSAPHIYGTVLEALELESDSSISFLNAGSGSMYLTCIAASILGPRSVHYGVEIHKDVIKHSEAAIKKWKQVYPEAKKIKHIDVVHGNALELVPDKGECAMGFDRIYIGAAIGSEILPSFKKLLKPGGILVGPGRLLHLLPR